jgi:DNA-binding transcriptional ArsR family regulator
MPTAIDCCISTVIIKVIKGMTESTIGKSINMNGNTASRHYSDDYNSEDNSNYDTSIDIAIINSDCRSVSSGELKKRVEQILGVTIPPSIFSRHIKKMLSQNELIKDDTGKRGEKSVFYSLTEVVKKRRELRLLRLDKKQSLFKKIYTNLFLHGITEGDYYLSPNLNEILSDIHVSNKDLVIDHIEEKSGSEFDNDYSQLPNVQEKISPVLVIVYYKPISGVSIVESTNYRENIFYGNFTEYTAYSFHIPGMSIKNFASRLYNFQPNIEDIEEAFTLLLRNGILKPIMEFRGETRYGLADNGLEDLIDGLRLFYKVEGELLYAKWNYLSGPTFDEMQRREAFFIDKSSCNKVFNKAELNRFEFENKIKGKNGTEHDLLQLKRLIEEDWKSSTYDYVGYIKKKHGKTIKEYGFLLEDILRIICPLLLQEFPVSEF